MRTEEFDFDLPVDRVAQEPSPERDSSRLMVLDRDSGAIVEDRFSRIGDHLNAGDLLVLNDTRVFPARLLATRPTGGRVELLLLSRRGEGDEAVWTCMTSPGRGLRPGVRLRIARGFEACVIDGPREGRATISLVAGPEGELEAIGRHGRVPLPPYIRRDEHDARHTADRERYQTVYARHEGAVAAPTAGLHFTRSLLDDLEKRGVATTRVTLHVGPGTFQPVRADRIEEHRIEAEWSNLTEETSAAIARCRARKGRVVAVGTTVTRLLESRADDSGVLSHGEGMCGLYIRPGWRFRVIDALITNFHLPRSSLLILVSAFAGRERILAAYREAVERRYRFYSYGDAMLIR